MYNATFKIYSLANCSIKGLSLAAKYIIMQNQGVKNLVIYHNNISLKGSLTK